MPLNTIGHRSKTRLCTGDVTFNHRHDPCAGPNCAWCFALRLSEPATPPRVATKAGRRRYMLPELRGTTTACPRMDPRRGPGPTSGSVRPRLLIMADTRRQRWQIRRLLREDQ